MTTTDRPVSDERAAEIAERTKPGHDTWDYVDHGTRYIDALLFDRTWCGEQIAQLQRDEKDSDGFARNASIEMARDKAIIRDQAAQIAALEANKRNLFVILDGPPSHESGRFVEVEDASGKSVCVGVEQRPDGLWALGPFRSVEIGRD